MGHHDSVLQLLRWLSMVEQLVAVGYSRSPGDRLWGG